MPNSINDTTHSHRFFEIPDHGMFVMYLDDKDNAIFAKADGWTGEEAQRVAKITFDLELYLHVNGEDKFIARIPYGESISIEVDGQTFHLPEFEDHYHRFNECYYEAEPALLRDIVKLRDQLPFKELIDVVFNPLKKGN